MLIADPPTAPQPKVGTYLFHLHGKNYCYNQDLGETLAQECETPLFLQAPPAAKHFSIVLSTNLFFTITQCWQSGTAEEESPQELERSRPLTLWGQLTRRRMAHEFEQPSNYIPVFKSC